MAEYFNPKVRVYVTKTGNVESMPLNEGNMIITEEGGEMYFDLEGRRVPIVPTWRELIEDGSGGSGTEPGGGGTDPEPSEPGGEDAPPEENVPVLINYLYTKNGRLYYINAEDYREKEFTTIQDYIFKLTGDIAAIADAINGEEI